MKRLTLLFVIAILVFTTSALQAAPPRRGSQSTLARHLIEQTVSDAAHGGDHVSLQQMMRHILHLRGHSPDRMLSPRRAAQAPPAVSANDLALPSAVLSAGHGTQQFVGSGEGPFSSYHHSWSGFQAGVAAVFDFQPIMTLSYQGSIFADAGSAGAFMMDGVTLTSSMSPVSPESCSDVAGGPCELVAFPVGTADLAIYGVAQINYCVIETGYQGNADLINQNVDDVSKVTAGVFALGIKQAQDVCLGSSPTPPTATPTPTPTQAPTSTATPTVTPTATSTATPTAPAAVLGLKVTVKGTLRAHHTGSIQVTVSGGPVASRVDAHDANASTRVRGAKVTVDGRQVGMKQVLHGKTDSRGIATFKKLRPVKPGTVKVSATKAGFASATITVRVRT